MPDPTEPTGEDFLRGVPSPGAPPTAKAVLMGLDVMPEPTEPYPDAYWRPLASCPPPHDGPCLICAPSADPAKPLITLAWHEDTFGWSLIPTMWAETITHWMPLPPPPAQEKPDADAD